MHKTITIWLFLALLGVAEGVYAQVQAPDTPGPWAVGRTTMTVVDDDRDGRSFDVDIWYPVDPEDSTGVAPASYDLIFTTLASPTALQSPPVSMQGARPLVVFSHGSGGIRYQSYFLTEALASHGFIVAAPDHAGNTAVDMVLGTEAPFEQMVIDRPRDISFVIDTLLARSGDDNDEFAGRIDASRIGVSGHSFGGYTSLAMASGFDVVAPDARVRAIAPLAPASLLFSDTDLAAIDIPALLVSGTQDITTPVEPNTTRPWELLNSPWRWRADIIDGGHQSFTNICAIAAALNKVGIPNEFVDFILGAVDEGCAPELIDIDDAHKLTQLYVISFMKSFLAGDPAYRQFLTPRYTVTQPLPVEFQEYIPGPLRPAAPR